MSDNKPGIPSKKTNVDEFIAELEAGTFKPKLAHILNTIAASQVTHGKANRKAKVNIELSLTNFGEGGQVLIASKLDYKALTPTGTKSESSVSESVFYVGRGGELTIERPKEEYNGQFQLVQQDKQTVMK